MDATDEELLAPLSAPPPPPPTVAAAASGAHQPSQPPRAAAPPKKTVAAIREEERAKLQEQFEAAAAAHTKEVNAMMAKMQAEMKAQMDAQLHLVTNSHRAATEKTVRLYQERHQRQVEEQLNPGYNMTPQQQQAAEQMRIDAEIAASSARAKFIAQQTAAYQQHQEMTSGAYGISVNIRKAMMNLHKQIAAFDELFEKKNAYHRQMRKGIATMGINAKGEADAAFSTYLNHPQQDARGFPLVGDPAQPPVDDKCFVMTVDGFDQFSREVLNSFYKTVVGFSEFTATFAMHFNVHPLKATGVVQELADMGQKKRRRENFCDCARDVCRKSSLCKCVLAGRNCKPGCSCYERVDLSTGVPLCRNRVAPASSHIPRLLPPSSSSAAAAGAPGAMDDDEFIEEGSMPD